jgi:hypothetical protein
MRVIETVGILKNLPLLSNLLPPFPHRCGLSESNSAINR